MSDENNVNMATIWQQYGNNIETSSLKCEYKLFEMYIYNKIELEKRQYNIIN